MLTSPVRLLRDCVYFDGVNGLLVEKDNVDAVVKAYARIYEDKELTAKLCEKGKQIVGKRFSVKRVVAEHEELFEKMGKRR